MMVMVLVRCCQRQCRVINLRSISSRRQDIRLLLLLLRCMELTSIDLKRVERALERGGPSIQSGRMLMLMLQCYGVTVAVAVLLLLRSNLDIIGADVVVPHGTLTLGKYEFAGWSPSRSVASNSKL